MKKMLSTIVLLLILSPLAFANEEDQRMPVLAKCLAVDSQPQETKWCECWLSALQRRESIRPMAPGDKAGIFLLTLVKYDQDGKKLVLSTTANLLSPFFAGQMPWIASKIDVLGEEPWTEKTEGILQTILEGVTAGLPDVMDSARKLQKNNKGPYKSVGGINEENIIGHLIGSIGLPSLEPDAM